MADQATLNGREKAGTALRGNVGDFVHDVITLTELQGRLLLVDLREARTRAVRPLAFGVVAVVLLLASFPVALLGLAAVLDAAGLATWAALLIAALIGIGVSGVLGWLAWRTIRTTVAVFKRSGDEFSQNLARIKGVLRSGQRPPEPPARSSRERPR
jgi:hypothetical protein